MHDIFKDKYNFIRDSYTGEGGYNPFSTYSYLTPFSREDKDFYSDRKHASDFENVFNPLQNLYLKSIFGAGSNVTSPNVNLQYIIENSMPMYTAKEALTDYKLYDLTYYSVETDLVEDEGMLVPDTNTAPTLNVIFPGDIDSIIMKGNRKIESMEYLEYNEYKKVNVPVLCEYDSSSNNIYKTTRAWINENGEIVLTETPKRLTIFDTITYGIIHKSGYKKLNETPDSMQLARTQFYLYNTDSLRTEILTKVAFPIFAIATNAELKEIILSVNNMLKVPEDAKNMPTFIEPDLDSIDKIRDTLEEKKSFIYKTFTSGLFSDNVKYTSAMSTRLASSVFLSELKDLYDTYQEIIINIFKSIVDIYDIDTNITYDFPELDLEMIGANLENAVNTFKNGSDINTNTNT